MSDERKFTPGDIRAWKAYEKVRASGRFNMFDPRAMRETGLNEKQYSFVMNNFSVLKAAHEKATQP